MACLLILSVNCKLLWHDLLFHLFYFIFLFFIFYFFLIYFLFLAVLGLRCCVWAFSSCGARGLLFFVVRGLLIAMASLVAEHGL